MILLSSSMFNFPFSDRATVPGVSGVSGVPGVVEVLIVKARASLSSVNKL